MPKNCKILIFCMIFVVKGIAAQQISPKYSTDKRFEQLPTKSIFGAYAPVYPHSVISPNFYVKNLSFFCRQELRLEALTKIPFKFRLGSVQYVDWLEKKPNSWILP
jgi:hypothetical protein